LGSSFFDLKREFNFYLRSCKSTNLEHPTKLGDVYRAQSEKKYAQFELHFFGSYLIETFED
jgi:hypothetical protein